MAIRAFPVLYARDVEGVAAFYEQLGFREFVRLAGQAGRAGYIGLRRDEAEMAVTTEDAARVLAGVEPGPGPRHEMFVYVHDLDELIERLRARSVRIVGEASDRPWGERTAYVADPEGNLVSLANVPGGNRPAG